MRHRYVCKTRSAALAIAVVLMGSSAMVRAQQPKPAPAGAKAGELICCNNLPAHTLQMQNVLQALCGDALAKNPTLGPVLDDLLSSFEKNLPTTTSTGMTCQVASVDSIPLFSSQTSRAPVGGCVLITEVYKSAMPVLAAAAQLCRAPTATTIVFPPPPCGCEHGCDTSAPPATVKVEVFVDAHQAPLTLVLAPEPQVASNTFASLTSVQIIRPGLPQLAGASIPLAFSPSGTSVGAGASVSPFRLLETQFLRQEAQRKAALEDAIATETAKQVLAKYGSDKSEDAAAQAGGKTSAAPLTHMRAQPFLGFSSEKGAATNGEPGDAGEASEDDEVLDYLGHCVPNPLSLLRDQSAQAGKTNLSDLQRKLAGIKPDPSKCTTLLKQVWPSIQDAITKRPDMGEPLTLGRAVDLLNSNYLKNLGSYGQMVLRSATLSISGSAPTTAQVSSSFGPIRGFTTAFSVDLLNTRDPLLKENQDRCVKERGEKLKRATQAEAKAILAEPCFKDVGGSIGLGAETSVRYRLPPPGAAAFDMKPEVEWDGFGTWLNGEIVAGPTATTFYAQTGAERDKAGSLIWRGASGGARFTLGGQIGSLSFELLGGNYLTAKQLVELSNPRAQLGAEGSLQASTELPMGLSLTAGGSVRCLEGQRCEGRFVTGIGWQQEPNWQKLIAVAAGRVVKE